MRKGVLDVIMAGNALHSLFTSLHVCHGNIYCQWRKELSWDNGKDQHTWDVRAIQIPHSPHDISSHVAPCVYHEIFCWAKMKGKCTSKEIRHIQNKILFAICHLIKLLKLTIIWLMTKRHLLVLLHNSSCVSRVHYFSLATIHVRSILPPGHRSNSLEATWGGGY